MALRNTVFVSVLFAAILLTIVCSGDAANCHYTIAVKTGGVKNSGTDARVSLTLNERSGNSVHISDLVIWGGAMNAGHDYFERGNLDLFVGSAACLSGPPCAMLLQHDNTGNKAGWYVDYVKVTVGSRQSDFAVNQWLARDEPPHQLYARRNRCNAARARP